MPRSHNRSWNIADVAESVAPPWRFLRDWLYWPPDVFALTSMVLRLTGCYRYVLDDAWEHRRSWQAEIETEAERWLKAIDACLARTPGPDRRRPRPKSSTRRRDRRDRRFRFVPPRTLGALADEIRDLARRVTVEELRALLSPDARSLCGLLIRMHCIADQACVGFGLLSSPRPEVALVHCLANQLLTARGTLSTLPKHHGIVLPKMRTPQSGLTLRSMSQQLTYHTTEVEVMWRSMPWANVQENTINVLAVPWPSQVTQQCFSAMPETFEPVRYFRYTPASGVDGALIERVVGLVRQANADCNRLHTLVFPELALAQEEYERLLIELKHARLRGDIAYVPMIVSGVRDIENRSDGPSAGPSSVAAPRGARRTNEVRLAAYFAGRWYELAQRKHHRWKLNRNQVLQYSLEGRLATARNWYEDIAVEQRRLSFLAPNGWLALCPLICEDLAQLEPVSDLIRGVGPTLLIALLMDGPQLTDRWSARYASVFADDPGTAVMTVTSAGMASQSHALAGPSDERALGPVALWKDQLTGWRPLRLEGAADALLLTISADWTEEFSADGRSDHQNAAVFKLEGARPYKLGPLSARSQPDAMAAARLRAEADEPSSPGKRTRSIGGWSDLRELSAATYALDAAIELRGKHLDQIMTWLLGRPNARWEDTLPARLEGIVGLVRSAQADPSSTGTKVVADVWPTPSLERVEAEMRHAFAQLEDAQSAPRLEYWRRLVRYAARALDAPEPVTAGAPSSSDAEWNDRRIKRAVPLMILMAVHARVERIRRMKPTLTRVRPVPAGRAGDTSPWTLQEAASLLEEVEAALQRSAY